MNEPVERPTPPLPAPRRPRRFVMPVEHHDSRTSERIEAFLEGPARPARRRSKRGVPRDRPLALETVLGWHEALDREQIRVERYGRAATVMTLDVAAQPGANGVTSVPADLVPPVLEAIRHEARETDHVVRTSPTRFQLLLPETSAADADHFAERLRRACAERLNGHGGALHLRVEMLTPGHGMSLVDALDATERRLTA